MQACFCLTPFDPLKIHKDRRSVDRHEAQITNLSQSVKCQCTPETQFFTVCDKSAELQTVIAVMRGCGATPTCSVSLRRTAHPSFLCCAAYAPPCSVRLHSPVRLTALLVRLSTLPPQELKPLRLLAAVAVARWVHTQALMATRQATLPSSPSITCPSRDEYLSLRNRPHPMRGRATRANRRAVARAAIASASSVTALGERQ